MSSYQVKPPEHYTMLELSEVLRRVAQLKGRPEPYALIVCQSLREAFLRGEPHPLRNDAVAMMNRLPKLWIKPTTPSQVRGGASSTILECYTPEQLEKVEYIAEWCGRFRGRYEELARHLKMPTHSLRRRAKITAKFSKGELSKAYAYAKKIDAQESLEHGAGLSLPKNKQFFVEILHVYCFAAFKAAYANVVAGIKDYRIKQDGYIEDFIHTGVIKSYGSTAKTRLLTMLRDMGLVLLPDDFNGYSPSVFKLADMQINRGLYHLAFKSILAWSGSECFSYALVNFRGSDKVRMILEDMEKYVIGAYKLDQADNQAAA